MGYLYLFIIGVEGFEAVGWVAGKASGL